MALPPKPTASATPSQTPVASAPSQTASETVAKKTVVLKHFGPAKIGEGDSAVAAPTPTAAGLNLVEVSKRLYATLTQYATESGVKLDEVLAFAADADKSQFPGHKDGRIAYATAGIVAGLGKMNGLLNKVRGLGGGAAMKQKIEEKDRKIKDLEAKLAAVMAQMGIKA